MAKNTPEMSSIQKVYSRAEDQALGDSIHSGENFLISWTCTVCQHKKFIHHPRHKEEEKFCKCIKCGNIICQGCSTEVDGIWGICGTCSD